jgi:hypothetical protein
VISTAVCRNVSIYVEINVAFAKRYSLWSFGVLLNIVHCAFVVVGRQGYHPRPPLNPLRNLDLFWGLQIDRAVLLADIPIGRRFDRVRRQGVHIGGFAVNADLRNGRTRGFARLRLWRTPGFGRLGLRRLLFDFGRFGGGGGGRQEGHRPGHGRFAHGPILSARGHVHHFGLNHVGFAFAKQSCTHFDLETRIETVARQRCCLPKVFSLRLDVTVISQIRLKNLIVFLRHCATGSLVQIFKSPIEACSRTNCYYTLDELE